MADYENSVPAIGAGYPVNATNSTFQRLEYIVDPAKLKTLYLFGIPMYSGIKDPITKRPAILDDETLQYLINNAATQVELDTGVTIFPTQFEERLPYDPQEFLHFGFFKVNHRPISSVESLAITSSDGVQIFQIAEQWVEPGYFQRGQVNIIPLSTANSSALYPVGGGGAVGSQWNMLMARQTWVPAYWTLKYTCGFPDGQVPAVLNQLIGVTAAMDVLSMLAATFARSTSHSLGIDSLSQSVSGPGPAMFQGRIKELQERQEMLKKKLKTEFGLTLFSGNV